MHTCKHWLTDTQAHTRTRASPRTLSPARLMFHKDAAHVKFMLTRGVRDTVRWGRAKAGPASLERRSQMERRGEIPPVMERERSAKHGRAKASELLIKAVWASRLMWHLTAQNGASDWRWRHASTHKCFSFVSLGFSDPPTCSLTRKRLYSRLSTHT